MSVLEELGWDNIPNSYWKQLENLVNLLNPFAHYTTLTSGEEITTISFVIPVILELSIHLKKMEEVLGLGHIANILKCELHRRFKYVVNLDITNFDPIFVAATFLSPGLREVLNDVQTKAAKHYILRLMKRDSIEIDDECHSNADQNEDSQTSELPPLKAF